MRWQRRRAGYDIAHATLFPQKWPYVKKSKFDFFTYGGRGGGGRGGGCGGRLKKEVIRLRAPTSPRIADIVRAVELAVSDQAEESAEKFICSSCGLTLMIYFLHMVLNWSRPARRRAQEDIRVGDRNDFFLANR